MLPQVGVIIMQKRCGQRDICLCRVNDLFFSCFFATFKVNIFLTAGKVGFNRTVIYDLPVV